jgi:Rrf2 family transcriptional regulator, cysteine metabolism repressor
MKVPTRAVYGLKALLYLADAYGQNPVSVSQIAKDEGISAAYLEQIFHRLKKRGWISSLRGPRGGYVLAKRPSELRVGDLLKDLHGGDFLKVPGEKPSKRSKLPIQASSIFWGQLTSGIRVFLDSVTLSKLLQEARNVQKDKNRHLSFSI